jgi:hypothetical protein
LSLAGTRTTIPVMDDMAAMLAARVDMARHDPPLRLPIDATG